MTIFVEKILIQLSNQALGDVNSHSKLNYTAVISNDHDIGQVHLFDEVHIKFRTLVVVILTIEILCRQAKFLAALGSAHRSP